MTHTTEQPGLHAHSWDAENDLMKRFLIYQQQEPLRYWLAVKSFDTYYDADEWLVFEKETDRLPTFILLSQSKNPEAEYKRVSTTGGEYRFANGNVYKIVDQFA